MEDLRTRKFCQIIKMTPEERKAFEDEFNHMPKMEFNFTPRGDCIISENGITVGIQRKNGEFIDKRLKK